jgi:hypothetical protein
MLSNVEINNNILYKYDNVNDLASASYRIKRGYITTVYSTTIDTTTLNTTQILNSSQNSNLLQETTSGDIVFKPVNGCVRPYTTKNYNLGSSSFIWNNAYVNTLNVGAGGVSVNSKKIECNFMTVPSNYPLSEVDTPYSLDSYVCYSSGAVPSFAGISASSYMTRNTTTGYWKLCTTSAQGALVIAIPTEICNTTNY